MIDLRKRDCDRVMNCGLAIIWSLIVQPGVSLLAFSAARPLQVGFGNCKLKSTVQSGFVDILGEFLHGAGIANT